MSRTFHYDRDENLVLITDHPSVRKHFAAKGLHPIPAGNARRLTMPKGTNSMAMGADYRIVNGNWKSL